MHTILEGKYMKILRIKNKKCEYSIDGSSFNLITNLSKEDILSMLEKIYSSSEICEVDDCENAEISNDVEKIMYKNYSALIKTFIQNIDKLKEEIKCEFEEVERKYNFNDN